LSTLFIICSVAIVLAIFLGAEFATPGWRDHSSTLLVAISALTLTAMTLGLALFYDDREDALKIREHLLITIGLGVLLWIVFGYSLAFSGGNDFVGGFSKAFLAGALRSSAPTFTSGVQISELSFVIFQGCIAVITPTLVVGALARQMKFSALLLFVPLWATLIYFPIAHMVWYWAGPDAISDAVKALAAAGDAAAKTAAQAKFDEVNTDAGWIYKKGAIDYAGGLVVALNAGVSGLIGFLLLYRRNASARRDGLRPMTGMGAFGLLMMWLAWFGFIAGSYLDFGDHVTRLAMANCFWATAAAAFAGAMTEWMLRGPPSNRGALYGALAGIVTVAPAAGYAGTTGAIVLGLCAGALVEASVNASRRLGFNALPDMPVIYFSGGVIGTLATGILASPALRGTGIMDYSTGMTGDYDFVAQMISQGWGVVTTLLWAGLGSLLIFKIIDMVVGLKPAPHRSVES
jgi:Amt family ammonium transporter